MRTAVMLTSALFLAAYQPDDAATPAVRQAQAGVVPTAPTEADPTGTYRRADPSNATLSLTRSGEAWDVVITAAGVPYGAATAADCEVRASGPLDGETITATVTSAAGVEQAETEPDPGQVRIAIVAEGVTVDDGQSVEGVGVAGRYCGMNSDITGLYARDPG